MAEKKYNVLHAGKSKGLSVGNAHENERRGWTEESYRNKNANPVNNYDWSRHNLNFEIVDGEIVPLGSQKTTLYTRYHKKLESVGYKAYKDGASNSQNTYVEIIFSADTEKMQKIAFGDQSVNYERNPEKWHNWDVRRSKEIEQWGRDIYNFGVSKFGKDSIIGCELHLDETEPHIHMNIVPLAERKQRGNVGGYVKIDKDGNDVRYTKGKHVGELIKLSKGKYEKLSDSKKNEYRPAKRGTVYTISYAAHFGSTTKERSEAMSQLHDEFYEEVGKKWGFERGEVWAELTDEEKAKKRRRTKTEAYIEAQLKQRIKEKQAEDVKAKQHLEQTNAELQKQKETLEQGKAEAEKYGKMNFQEKTVDLEKFADLKIKGTSVETLFSNCFADIDTIIAQERPEGINEKDWKREQQRKVKERVTLLETSLFGADGISYQQKKAITEFGKNLYIDAKKKVANILKENESLKEEIKEAKRFSSSARAAGISDTIKAVKRAAQLYITDKNGKETAEDIGKAWRRNYDNRLTAENELKKKKAYIEEQQKKYNDLQTLFDETKDKLEKEVTERAKERAQEKEEAMLREEKHREHINAIKGAILAVIGGNYEKAVKIILSQMAKDMEDFAIDTVNELKEVIFGSGEDLWQRRQFVSDSFAWAKVYASIENIPYRNKEALQEDAIRIADGTWQPGWKEDRSRKWQEAVDAIVEMGNDRNLHSFNKEQAEAIVSYYTQYGEEKEFKEITEEMWREAKPQIPDYWRAIAGSAVDELDDAMEKQIERISNGLGQRW